MPIFRLIRIYDISYNLTGLSPKYGRNISFCYACKPAILAPMEVNLS